MASILDDLKYTWRKPNSVMARLILVNVFVFVLVGIINVFSSPEFFWLFFQNLAMPTSLLEGSAGGMGYISPLIHKPWTFFTAFFTHKGFGHILWNMLAFYWFGMVIRDFMGDRKLLSLYFLGGIVGSISMIVLFNLIPRFSDATYGLGWGASAAVFAIMVAAATKFPDYQFNLLFIGPVKLKYSALVMIFLSFIGLKGSNVGGEVAHLAGAVMGFIYIKQLNNGTDLGRPILIVSDFIMELFKPKPKIKVTHRSGSKWASKKSSKKGRNAESSNLADPPQEEIDAILDKISQSGYDSLTTDEKQKLFNASNK
ncbi:MAG: rhomboid family intramembrane serine protease [Cyclobacteriaceae bacterium]